MTSEYSLEGDADRTGFVLGDVDAHDRRLLRRNDGAAKYHFSPKSSRLT